MFTCGLCFFFFSPFPNVCVLCTASNCHLSLRMFLRELWWKAVCGDSTPVCVSFVPAVSKLSIAALFLIFHHRTAFCSPIPVHDEPVASSFGHCGGPPTATQTRHSHTCHNGVFTPSSRRSPYFGWFTGALITLCLLALVNTMTTWQRLNIFKHCYYFSI